MPRKKALILDTNVILRFLLGDAPELYEKAYRVFQWVEEGKLEVFLSDVVLSECVWVLEKFYGIPWEQIAKKLLQADAVLTKTPKPALEEGLSIWETSPLDWTDALLVAKTTYKDTKLITFDGEIARKFPEQVFSV